MNNMYLNIDCIYFELERYSMDLRKYLKKHRDHRKLNDILLQVVAGLKELHGMGYVHRDLKPDNIVLNINRPINVVLIDFDRALPVTNKSHSGIRGTPGYQPDKDLFAAGAVEWDIYSLVCIIVECDMEGETYKRVSEERAGKSLIKKHCETKGTCKILADLAHSVLLNENGFFLPSLEEVEESVKKIVFKKHK
jgi:serine/threonine protein kinase